MGSTMEGAAAAPGRRVVWRRLAGGLALAFGIATLAEGGHTLFGGESGATVVPFVLAFNFGAGFFYVAAGAATIAGRPWAVWLARAIALATAGVFVAFAVHVLEGGAYAPRTVGAMTVRTVFWLAQALALPALVPPAGRGPPSR